MLVFQCLLMLTCAVMVGRYWLVYANDWRVGAAVAGIAGALAWTIGAVLWCDMSRGAAMINGLALLFAIVHDTSNPVGPDGNIVTALVFSRGRKWPDVAQATIAIVWAITHIDTTCNTVSYSVGGVLLCLLLSRAVHTAALVV